MKVASNVKPKKKKVVGVKQTTRPGEIVQKGEKPKVVQTSTVTAGKRTYTPSPIQTSDKRYGKHGPNESSELQKDLGEARSRGALGVTSGKKGLVYQAGTAKWSDRKPELKTTVTVKPEIRKLDIDRKPVYETGPSKGSSGGKLKARAQTRGGSTKGDHPATKYGTGFKSGKVKIRRVVQGGK